MSESLRIVIVGGVAGGMSAAARARRLDEHATITVIEKGPYVSYANCGIPYALGGVINDDNALILQTPEALSKRFNIDVRTHSTVMAIDRLKRLVRVARQGRPAQDIPYDKLLLALGAESFRPPIPGGDAPHVFTLQTIDDLKSLRAYVSAKSCKHVVVIGGGFIGLEAAENLRHLGLEVSVVEKAPQVFAPFDADMAQQVHTELRAHGIRLLLNADITRIEPAPNGRIVLANGEVVPADAVVMAIGVRARTDLARAAGLELGKSGVTVNPFMQTSDPNIYAVGDMVETYHRVAQRAMPLALAGPANRQGRLAADHMLGKAQPYRGNVGTSVCQVFDQTAASTGLSVRILRSLGRDVEWVTVHPQNHAGYYPGAQPLTLKVIFEQGTGVLLGAQAVGLSGVDKRIDVLSTAIQAGMTVFDLEHLELAYAPPYGSAKDPINMAGFVGSNVLRGDTRILHTESLQGAMEEGAQVLDVRSPAEFERGHVPTATNIPIDTLRLQLNKIDKHRPVVVYCWVGFRGYLAYRILHQHGFDVRNLDGGFKSVVDSNNAALQDLPEVQR